MPAPDRLVGGDVSGGATGIDWLEAGITDDAIPAPDSSSTTIE